MIAGTIAILVFLLYLFSLPDLTLRWDARLRKRAARRALDRDLRDVMYPMTERRT